MRELEEQASKGGQGTTPSAQGSGVTDDVEREDDVERKDDVEREDDFCGSLSPPTWGGGRDLTTKGKNSPSLCM